MINNIKLENEIQQVLNSSVQEEFPTFSVILHTPDSDTNIKHLTNIDVERDFEKALTDIIFLEFLVQIGDYAEDIYKNRNTLEVSLCIKRGLKQNCTRYKALILNVDKNIADSKIQSLNKDDLNKTNLVELKVQLIPLELMIIKKIEHEGIYGNANIESILKYTLNYELSKLKLHGEYFNLNYNIYPPLIKDKLESVIIPTGTKMAKIPSYLQEHYGVYNFDANIYFRVDNDIKKNFFYWVYPIVDFDRVNKDQNIGIIYNTARQGISSSEASYYKKHHQLKLVTDETQVAGDNYNNLFNNGKGFEFQSVSNNLKSFSYDVSTDIDNYSVNNKLLMVNDGDGMDNTINIGLTDNINRVTSVLNHNKLAHVQTTVYNFSGLWGSNPLEELIYPGMPFYYIYNNNKNGLNTAKKLPGTLLKQHISFDITKQTMMSVLWLGVKKPLLVAENK